MTIPIVVLSNLTRGKLFALFTFMIVCMWMVASVSGHEAKALTSGEKDMNSVNNKQWDCSENPDKCLGQNIKTNNYNF